MAPSIVSSRTSPTGSGGPAATPAWRLVNSRASGGVIDSIGGLPWRSRTASVSWISGSSVWPSSTTGGWRESQTCRRGGSAESSRAMRNSRRWRKVSADVDMPGSIPRRRRVRYGEVGGVDVVSVVVVCVCVGVVSVVVVWVGVVSVAVVCVGVVSVVVVCVWVGVVCVADVSLGVVCVVDGSLGDVDAPAGAGAALPGAGAAVVGLLTGGGLGAGAV